MIRSTRGCRNDSEWVSMAMSWARREVCQRTKNDLSATLTQVNLGLGLGTLGRNLQIEGDWAFTARIQSEGDPPSNRSGWEHL